MRSPQEQDRLAQLWARAREYERRTVSSVTVTQAGVALLQVTPLPADLGKSQVVVRDGAGHDLLKNDTNSGWGLAAPQSAVPAYPMWPAIPASGGSFVETWLFVGRLYSPNIGYGYIHGSEFATTFAETRVEYNPGNNTAWTAVTGSTTQSNEDVSNTATVFTLRAGTFTVPLSAAGQTYGIRLVSRVASGAGLKAWSTPVYLNQV